MPRPPGFFLYKIPFIISQITPVGILLSVLVVFGLMNKRNEIIALKSGGVSIYVLARPVLFMGIIFSILLFFLSEVIVPITVDKANEIWVRRVRHESAFTTREKNIWIKQERAIIHIKYYNPGDKAIYGVTVNRFDDGFLLKKRLDAEKGVYQNNTWVLSNVLEQNLAPDKKEFEVTRVQTAQKDLGFAPNDLVRVAKKSEEMGFLELAQYIRKVESEGYDATAYRVDLFAKIALPFACVIMAILGTGVALKPSRVRGRSMAIQVAAGLGISFLFFIFHSFCVSLGYGEMLPPAMAVWISNFVFFCFGIITPCSTRNKQARAPA